MHSVSEAEGQWNYAVDYDPDKVGLDRMLKALSGLGYRPSRHGSISARVQAGGLEVRARSAQATLERGEEGQLKVRLAPHGGDGVDGELAITASSEALGIDASSSVDGVGEARQVELDVTPSEDAEAGAHDVVVVVGTSDDAVRLRVTVYVE